MTVLRNVALAAWEFLFEKDWRLAAGTAVALGGTAVLAGLALNAWWFAPVVAVLVLAISLHVSY